MNTTFSRFDEQKSFLANLSTSEKLLGLAVIGLAGYMLYNEFAAPASADPSTLLRAGKIPSALLPAPQGMTPVAYTSAARTGGALSYVVSTKTNPLNIRSGPGTSYNKIGEFFKDSTVLATGNLVDGGEMTWAEVKTPDGSIGWASTSYLTATPQAQLASALSGIQNALGTPV